MQSRGNDPSTRQRLSLPIIAPRSENTQSGQEEPPSAVARSFPSTPRTRLPPRSRSGCWTCRLRKVKCDERRPTCGQCARLGHICDYNPRLAFRDDTPRVLERLQDITTSGNFVWDPLARRPDQEADRHYGDSLPAFAALSNDEDRERKAESQLPGTFLVVTNPESFSSLPEYRDEETSPQSATPVEMRSNNTLAIDTGVGVQLSSKTVPEDPNIVILRVFEDSTSPRTALSTGAPTFPVPTAVLYSNVPTTEKGLSGPSTRETSPTSRIDEARRGGRDAHLLRFYRSNISKSVTQVAIPDDIEDIFEIQARSFPPLFHAMMALSALGLANKNGSHQTDALEHYQQVIPAIRDVVGSHEDSISNGALYTHYLLLLYEIAHNGPWQSNMWQHHCDRLLSIVKARKALPDSSRLLPSFIWIICLVDLYALLSGSGAGRFVESIMKDNTLLLSQTIQPWSAQQPQLYTTEELPYFPALLSLNQETVSLAVRIGTMAKKFREEARSRRHSAAGLAGHENALDENRDSLVLAAQRLCRESDVSWTARFPQCWPLQLVGRLPFRVQALLDHARSLYHTCVIYAHTSMYRGQMSRRTPESNAEVAESATAIIEICGSIVSDRRWQSRHVTFALFMAGFATTVPTEKVKVFNIFSTLETQCYGVNTTLTKQFLMSIYTKQQEAARAGSFVGIDWIEKMLHSDLRLVMFGQ